MKSDSVYQSGPARWRAVAMVLVIVIVGLACAYYILNSAPKPGRIKPEVKARLVEAEALQLTQQRPSWTAGGQVIASQQVQLSPQVSGRIVDIAANAVPGARLSRGDLLARIDDADYQLVVDQRQAALAQARAALAIEQGQSRVAEEEFRMAATQMSDDDKALVLRQPQIAQAKAAVDSARANLKQAQLDLARTQLRMPFDGQINSRTIALGSQVSSATNAFDLVNSEQFWIQVKVPADFLALLDAEQPVMIRQSGWGEKHRLGRVLHVLPLVDSADRQAQLLVALDDPLARQDVSQPPVLLNDFVEVTLYGQLLADSYLIANRYIDDQQRSWVVNDGKLQQRQLRVLYQGRQSSWVAATRDESQGLHHGDRLLSSRVDAPVADMPVRVVGDQQPSTGRKPDAERGSR